jgi:hypothetical protein
VIGCGLMPLSFAVSISEYIASATANGRALTGCLYPRTVSSSPGLTRRSRRCPDKPGHRTRQRDNSCGRWRRRAGRERSRGAEAPLLEEPVRA